MRWRVASSAAVIFLMGPLSGQAGAQACADKGAKSALETCSLPPPPSKKGASKTISGRCELVIGALKPVSCARIQVLLRSHGGKKSEERAAVIDGFNFKFTDLGQSSYDLRTVSQEFDLKQSPPATGLVPGQSDLKIRIDATPKN